MYKILINSKITGWERLIRWATSEKHDYLQKCCSTCSTSGRRDNDDELMWDDFFTNEGGFVEAATRGVL